MKKYLYTAALLLVVCLLSVLSIQKKEFKKYKYLYNKELNNVEAYREANSGLEGSIRQFQMTVDDLRESRDSIDRKLTEAIDELKLKDKRIEYLQYQTKVIYRTDTVKLSDTIFVKETHIDTLLGDKWYSLGLKLDYPATITVSPTFNTEQIVVINTKKEFNNKPSKLFIIRKFQKKHTVVEVNMEEKSPYVINKENKFIKVLK